MMKELNNANNVRIRVHIVKTCILGVALVDGKLDLLRALTKKAMGSPYSKDDDVSMVEFPGRTRT